MKYKVGDRVRIKSIDWYNKNKNKRGNISFPYEVEVIFTPDKSAYCGQVVTISKTGYTQGIGFYRIKEDYSVHMWTDEMIECKVEEETKFGTALNPLEIKSNANCLTQERADEINKPKPKFKVGDKVILDPYPCVVTDVNWRDSLHGFVYTVRGIDFAKMVGEEDLVLDERTVPNTNEIIHLIKNAWNNFKDRYDIPDDYHFVDKNGNEINISEIVLEKKKKEYPKTYEECADYIESCYNEPFCAALVATGYKSELIESFARLLICRDAYWKIAGEEMGLGKPWEYDCNSGYFTPALTYRIGSIQKVKVQYRNAVLSFPTEEMRDAFYENFKDLIEFVKELL